MKIEKYRRKKRVELPTELSYKWNWIQISLVVFLVLLILLYYMFEPKIGDVYYPKILQ